MKNQKFLFDVESMFRRLNDKCSDLAYLLNSNASIRSHREYRDLIPVLNDRSEYEDDLNIPVPTIYVEDFAIAQIYPKHTRVFAEVSANQIEQIDFAALTKSECKITISDAGYKIRCDNMDARDLPMRDLVYDLAGDEEPVLIVFRFSPNAELRAVAELIAKLKKAGFHMDPDSVLML